MDVTPFIDRVIDRATREAVFSESSSYFIAALRRVLAEELLAIAGNRHRLLVLVRDLRRDASGEDGRMSASLMYELADAVEQLVARLGGDAVQ